MSVKITHMTYEEYQTNVLSQGSEITYFTIVERIKKGRKYFVHQDKNKFEIILDDMNNLKLEKIIISTPIN